MLKRQDISFIFIVFIVIIVLFLFNEPPIKQSATISKDQGVSSNADKDIIVSNYLQTLKDTLHDEHNYVEENTFELYQSLFDPDSIITMLSGSDIEIIPFNQSISEDHLVYYRDNKGYNLLIKTDPIPYPQKLPLYNHITNSTIGVSWLVRMTKNHSIYAGEITNSDIQSLLLSQNAQVDEATILDMPNGTRIWYAVVEKSKTLDKDIHFKIEAIILEEEGISTRVIESF